MILCPAHGKALAPNASGQNYLCPNGCSFPSPAPGVVDLLPEQRAQDQTSEHYSLQWGSDVDFASFYRSNPDALSVMTSKQMGWPALIARIREQSNLGRVRLLDAACGYGGLFQDLFAKPAPAGLNYLGADIHGALMTIRRPDAVEPDRSSSCVGISPIRFRPMRCSTSLFVVPPSTTQSIPARRFAAL